NGGIQGGTGWVGQHIQSFDTHRAYYVDAVLREIRSSFPGSFLPVDPARDQSLGFLQIGFSLWLFFAWGAGKCLRSTGAARGIALLLSCCCFSLLLFLWPVSPVTDWLWWHVPAFVCTITRIWPMQRLYMVLAGLMCFVAALGLKEARGKTIMMGAVALSMV